MAHHNTVFAQMLKLIPRHEFESLANQHHSGRRLRKMTRLNIDRPHFYQMSVCSRWESQKVFALVDHGTR